jgi:hypothetical protein
MIDYVTLNDSGANLQLEGDELTDLYLTPGTLPSNITLKIAVIINIDN